MAAWFRRNRGAPQRTEPTPTPDTSRALGEDSPAELDRLVTELVWYLNAHSGQLPTQAVVTARYVCDLLSATIATAQSRPLDVYAVISVKAIASDYLRTSVATYLAAAQTLETGPESRGADPHAALLTEQLGLLWDSAAEVFAAAKARDVDALRTQGNFLRTKFSRSDLEL